MEARSIWLPRGIGTLKWNDDRILIKLLHLRPHSNTENKKSRSARRQSLPIFTHSMCPLSAGRWCPVSVYCSSSPFSFPGFLVVCCSWLSSPLAPLGCVSSNSPECVPPQSQLYIIWPWKIYSLNAAVKAVTLRYIASLDRIWDIFLFITINAAS